ncbi:MAG: DUF11 domain-containing protein, partial [Gemmatimonadaceae bacterium]|nr:DUF11 domain-containing protein [Gemmatimonadaceae bacterium]
GQNATWRLRVRAVGPSPAPGPITLTDSLHAGLTFVAASGGGFTCTNAAPLVSCTRATGLASGDSAIVLLTTLVGAGALPTASNTARVAVAGDANAANDTARVSGVPIVGVPDLTLTKTAVGMFATSQPASYTLRVANIGSAAATDSIVVTDSLPTGLTFTSATGPGFTCTFSAPVVRCVRTTSLAGGGTVDVTVGVTPGAAALPQVTNRATVRTPGDVAAANDTGTVVTPVVSVPDLAIAKTFTGPMTIGQPATYRLAVRNVSPGPTTATITLTDSLVAGLAFVGATGPGFACSFAAPLVSCSRPAAIAAGDSAIVTLTVTPTGAVAGAVTNRAWVATAGDLNAFNDTTVTPPRTVQRPDLAIEKSHTGSFTALDTLGTVVNTWTLTVRNTGTAATTGTITAIDSLPANVAFVSTPSPGWSCAAAGPLAAGQVVTCTNAGPLGPGAAAPLLLRVSARPAAAGSVTNIARVSTPDDVNPANDRATDPTVIVAAPDLRLSKSNNVTLGAQVLPLEVGAPDQRYRFAVTNVGAGPTTGPIVIVDTLPTGIHFTSSAGGGGFSCVATDSVPGPSPRRRIVTCTRAAALAAGATAQDSITIAVLAAAIPSVANTAQVTTAGDPNPANDRATDGATPVVNPLDLTIGKSPQGAFTIGSTATYQISVTNLGSGTSTLATTVTDTLAPGLTFVSGTGDNFTCSVTSTLPGPPSRQVVTCTRPAGGPSATNGIESGIVYVFDLVVNVAAAALPAQDNRVWVANGDDTNATNNSFATGTVLVVSAIDLALTKSPVGPIVVNSTATFNLAVANIGASATTAAITITDTLPVGLGLTSVSGSGGGFGACTVPDSVPGPSPRRRIVQCVRPAAPALGAGAQATLALTVSVAPSAFPAVQNAARVATTGDLNPVNDTSSTALLPVTSVPDFSLVKTGSSPLQVGVPAVFELVVANASPIAPGGNTAPIVVTDTLPLGLAFDATGTAANARTIASGFTCSVTTIAGPRDVVTCTRGAPPGTPALVQGEEVTLVLLATVTPAAV